MPQNHTRWSPDSCSCVLDVIIDTDTGGQTLFAIRNICDNHKPIATIDPDFETKKQAILAQRYAQLDDNRTRNYQQIDAYTDLQMSPADKSGCKANVDRHTIQGKTEYDLLLSQPDSNLYFCTNVHTSVLEEASRYPKVYNRIQTQFNLTDDQMKTITYSFTGKAPNRVLTINFGALITANQKTAAQTWADNNIGVGRVVVL